MVTIVIGRAKTGKSTYCFRRFSAKILAGNPETPSYYIVPEQYTVSAERSLLNRPELRERVLIQDEVLSFKRLVYRILSRLGGFSADILDEQGRVMLLTQIAAQERKRLSYYAGLYDNSWQIAEVASLFSEFEKYAVLPEKLKEASEQDACVGTLSEKLRDLAFLYECFLTRLHEIGMTEADVFRIATEKARRKGYFRGSSVWIDEFTGFTALERELLTLMMEDSADLTVTLCMDTNGEPVFDGIGATYEALRKLTEQVGVPCCVVDLNRMPEDSFTFYRSETLQALEKRFSALRTEPVAHPAGESPVTGIEIHESRNPFTEIAYAAESIQKLHRKGVPYAKIAVAVRNPEQYGPLIEAVFSGEKIPFFMDTRRSIAGNPLILAIQALLEIPDGGFRYENIAALLRSRLYFTDQAEADSLDYYIRSTGLQGEKRWKKEQNESCRSLFRDLLLFKEDLQAAETLSACVSALRAFMQRAEFEPHLMALCVSLDREEYGRIWETVQHILDQLVLFLGDIPVSSLSDACGQLRRLLSAAFSSYKTGFLPQNPDAVSIVGIDRSRISELQALFLLGANEGVLPATVSDTGILNDQERAWMTERAIELADDSTVKSCKEQFMIYASLFAPRDFLCVSYPLQDASGIDLLPSASVVRRLRQLLPTLSVTTDAYFSREPDFLPPRESCLQDQTAKILFLPGTDVSLSVSRIERYRECPFRYFMEYGLKAKEPEDGTLTGRDIGNLMHALLEAGSKKLSQTQEYGTEKAACEELMSKLFPETAEAVWLGKELDSEREKSNARRLVRFAAASLYSAIRQIETGSFVSVGFEIPFGSGEAPIPAVSIPVGENGIDTVRLEGKIDRFDVFAEDDRIFVRVVDYKSSDPKLQRDNIERGLRIQLLTYLKALTEQPENRRAVAKLAGKPEATDVLPGGALYFVIDDDIVSKSKCPEEKYRMTGLVLDDGAVVRAMVGDGSVPVISSKGKNSGSGMYLAEPEYEVLSRRISDTVRETVLSISHGRFTPEPKMIVKDRSSCKYCPYGAVCGIRKKKE